VALRRDSEHWGVTGAVEILVFLIWQLLHWLLFGCQNSQNSQRRAEATCANAADPNQRFYEPGHIGCRTVALPNSGDCHNLGNLACCPDFKVSHYRLTSTDAVSYDSKISI